MFKYFAFLLTISFFCVSNAADSLLTLEQKLDRLQREVSDLSQNLFSDPSNSESQKSNDTNEASYLTSFDLRIYDLEKDIKKLNNSFEDIIFQLDDLKNLYEDLILNISTQQLNFQNNTTSSEEKNLENKKNSSLGKKLDDNLGSIIIKSLDLSNSEEKLNNEDNNINRENQDVNLSLEDEFQNALDFLRGQKFDDAKYALKNFINKYESSNLSGSAHYWLGEIYLLEKNYKEAALILAEGYQKFPRSVKSPDMLYKLSESLLNIDKKDDSCNTLKKLNQEFPKHKINNKVKSKMKDINCNYSE